MQRLPLLLLAAALLSGATLLGQVALTRVLAIAQGYHFAFLVISLALLGFGASGTLLAVLPRLREPRLLPWYAAGYGLLTVGGFLFVDRFPFDPYLVARQGVELALLFADLVALALPFVFAGLLIGALLTHHAERAGIVYGASLFGSGLGAALAPAVLDVLGSERSVVAAALGGSVAAIALAVGRRREVVARRSLFSLVPLGLIVVGLAVVLAVGIELHPSPYRRLSQIRLDPDARVLATRQDSHARLDIVTSPSLRSAPGLSLAHTGPLPATAGLIIDGNDLLPVPAASDATRSLGRALPVVVAHRLRPGGDVLVLGSGGGSGAWSALELGARAVTVVEPNPLVADALTVDLRSWSGLADDPRVRIVEEPLRSFVQREQARYDVVELTLTDAYRPVSSGAISLTEDYRLTVDAFRSYLRMLESDGLFVVTRWVQARPSESIRTLGLIVEALGTDRPRDHVLAFRSFQTVTFIASPRPLTATEVDALFAAIDELRYDLVLAPVDRPDLLNRWAQLPTLDEHEQALALATSAVRGPFYAANQFDVTPPSDDRPFFFHFFRLEQVPALLAEMGLRWQPFGGGGYFILVVLLIFAVMAAGVAIVAPLLLRRGFRAAIATQPRLSVRVVGYVVAIGLAFLFVEVTMVQRAILVLGHPTPAFATVVGTLLAASGVGSALSPRIPWRTALLGLGALLAVHAGASWLVGPSLLALPDPVPLLAVVALTAPVGFLMGIPFARAVQAIAGSPSLVAWAWAANGSASVVSGIIATMVALSFGFGAVLWLAAALYLLAAVLAPATRPLEPAARS